MGGAAPRILQPTPAKLEIFRSADDIRRRAAGYKMVQKPAAGIAARAQIAYGEDVVFRVSDRWTLSCAPLSVHQKIDVVGSAPGALYGDPTYDGDRSPGGTLKYAARRIEVREDVLPAPLFALSFNNGASAGVLDPAPCGDTTVDDAGKSHIR